VWPYFGLILASPEVDDNDCGDDDDDVEEEGETPTGKGEERGFVYLEETCVTLVIIAW
jgi:hypothetical protein